MKQLPILFFLFIISCKNEDEKPASPEAPAQSTTEVTVFNCFNGPDTIMTGEARGCENRFYKLADPHNVLQIEYNGEIQYDSCIKIKIDSLQHKGMGKLLLYGESKADFNYFCNDYGTGPEREIKAINGTIYFRFYPPDKGGTESHSHKVSIWVPHLEFWDDARKKKIEVDNILYYKVKHWTWYGDNSKVVI
jgi:hypothetical protein